MEDFSFIPPDERDLTTAPDLLILAEDFPVLYRLLIGRPKSDRCEAMAPGTIMLFLDGGKLKWCFSPKTGPWIAFGVCDDLSKPLTSLEKAVRAGAFDWRERSRQSPRR